MQRCLALAEKGLGNVSPNPMVGCVLVVNENIVAEGYHEIFGGPHAEPNAIAKLDDESLKHCTLYVNLEPCSHFGKTPPCVDLIIKKEIRKVVIGSLDPNPIVSGSGIKKLREAGVEVLHGILEKECVELNKRFFTFHTKKRPYIILKWAQTKDGFISRFPLPEQRADNFISGHENRQLAHQWRSSEQAILIGYNTLANDNPSLTTRLVDGKNPIRFLISKDLNFSDDLNLFDSAAPTVVFNGVKNSSMGNVKFVKINYNNACAELLDYCYNENIQSILIEGGTKTIETFLQSGLWDEARIFVNPFLEFKTGILAPQFDLKKTVPSQSGNDLLYTILN